MKIIKEKVVKALNRVRPYLQNDGGDIDLIEITDDLTVKVKLTGACHGCPFAYADTEGRRRAGYNAGGSRNHKSGFSLISRTVPILLTFEILYTV